MNYIQQYHLYKKDMGNIKGCLNWKTLFEKNMFWLFLLTTIISGFIEFNGVRGLNETIQWQHDESNDWLANGTITILSTIFYIIGYGIIFLIRRKTILILSFIHFGVYVLTILVAKTRINLGSTIINYISLVIFGLNMFLTLRNNQKQC